MSHTLNTARVGLFFLLGVALIWIVYQSLGDGTFFREEGYQISVQFDDLKQLKPGDEVRMAGVKIGSVSQTRLVGGRGEAVMTIDPEVAIPDDSLATVAMAGLLGNNFIAIRVGESGTDLANGASIGGHTTPDLNEAIGTISALSTKFDEAFDDIGATLAAVADADDGLVRNLNELIKENRDNIRETVANLREVSDALARGEGTLGKLIQDDEAYDSILSLGGSFDEVSAEATLLVQDLREIVDQVKSGEGTIGALIYDETTAEELRSLVRNLEGVSQMLASGEGTLGRLVADDTLYQDLQAVLQKAERTIDGLGDQGPITAVGITANALF